MSDADDTDMTEGDIDQAMTSGTPVEIRSVTDPEYLLQLYTQALAEHDCADLGTDVPEKDHPFWQVWRAHAEAVLKVRDRHLDQLRQRLNIAITGIGGLPSSDYASVWSELTGFVDEAVDDGGTIDPQHMQAYMRELKRKANAPTRAWFNSMLRRPNDEEV